LDENIYCQSEKDDEEQDLNQEDEQMVLNPSKTKFNKFLEDIRQREIQNNVAGTFGEGDNGFTFVVGA
jgi:hypothetical protein